MDNDSSHREYIPTRFYENELDLIRENGKLEEIRLRVPDYDESDLT